MNTEVLVSEAAATFGYADNCGISGLETGLINKTFVVRCAGKKPILLQQINATVFKNPADVQFNYECIYRHLSGLSFFIPAPLRTTTNNPFWVDENAGTWRAMQFVENSFSRNQISSVGDAIAVASCFGAFAAAFQNFPASQLKITIPKFHDLNWRYQQFDSATANPKIKISPGVNAVLDELKERKYYLRIYEGFSDPFQFPDHVMHHDCKINNILFDKSSNAIIGPVDMDTVMPGKFFSDLGDMIRTMCCAETENSTAWEKLKISPGFYDAVVSAYTNEISGLFTSSEQESLHLSGPIVTYMQALRFITDFLNGNRYYKTAYQEQNYDRAKNQLLLLQSLEGLPQVKTSLSLH